MARRSRSQAAGKSSATASKETKAGVELPPATSFEARFASIKIAAYVKNLSPKETLAAEGISALQGSFLTMRDLSVFSESARFLLDKIRYRRCWPHID